MHKQFDLNFSSPDLILWKKKSDLKLHPQGTVRWESLTVWESTIGILVNFLYNTSQKYYNKYYYKC